MQKHLMVAAQGQRCLTNPVKKEDKEKLQRESAIRSLSPLLVFGAVGLPPGDLEGSVMLSWECSLNSTLGAKKSPLICLFL